VSETVTTFGTGQHLVGTLNTPTQIRPGTVAFVLLNAGVIARMGPRRFNVKLARHLASLGFHSLRFDLSGQGDSQRSDSTAPHAELVRIDIQSAMDHITALTGIQRFVIAGICSGANAGFDMAQRDPRVVGLWMFDGHAYGTFKSKLVRYWLQLTREFRATLLGWGGRLLGKRPIVQPEPTLRAPSGTPGPSREAYAAGMQALVDRGVKVLMMYSSDVLWHYSYQNQFRDTFKGHAFVNKVECLHQPDVDHTLTALASQHQVITRIGEWAQTFALM